MGRRRLIAGILGVIMAVVMAFAVVPPKVAQAAGAYSAYKVSFDYWWWLRTPNEDSRYAMCVESGGGDVTPLSLVLEAGIRPALQVDLSALCFSAETNTFSLLNPVTAVTLDCTVKQTITVGDTLSFKADVYPENATYKTVIWSVSNGNVRLYADKACTKEVGTKATTTMTVYAKGVNAGDATITVTSSYHSDRSSSCDITVKKKKAKKTGTWKHDKNGWWYKLSDGTWPKNCWKKIDGKWYYFKKTGYAAQSEFVKGWWVDKNCVQSDPVQCSWHKDKNGWWYGGGKWYAKNATYTIDGKAYTFDKEGYCVE